MCAGCVVPCGAVCWLLGVLCGAVCWLLGVLCGAVCWLLGVLCGAVWCCVVLCGAVWCCVKHDICVFLLCSVKWDAYSEQQAKLVSSHFLAPCMALVGPVYMSGLQCVGPLHHRGAFCGSHLGHISILLYKSLPLSHSLVPHNHRFVHLLILLMVLLSLSLPLSLFLSLSPSVFHIFYCRLESKKWVPHNMHPWGQEVD